MRYFITMIVLASLAQVSMAYTGGMQVASEDIEAGQDLGWFHDQTVAVQQQWTRALAPVKGQHDPVRLRVDVRVDHTGQLVGAQLGRSSGDAGLDERIVNSLTGTPFDAPPPGLSDEYGTVGFSVYFELQAQDGHAARTQPDAA